jgi:hypothetical protein
MFVLIWFVEITQSDSSTRKARNKNQEKGKDKSKGKSAERRKNSIHFKIHLLKHKISLRHVVGEPTDK